LRKVREGIRPIYRELGILPSADAPVNAVIQDSVAR
jgi:hypothetical protein